MLNISIMCVCVIGRLTLTLIFTKKNCRPFNFAISFPSPASIPSQCFCPLKFAHFLLACVSHSKFILKHRKVCDKNEFNVMWYSLSIFLFHFCCVCFSLLIVVFSFKINIIYIYKHTRAFISHTSEDMYLPHSYIRNHCHHPKKSYIYMEQQQESKVENKKLTSIVIHYYLYVYSCLCMSRWIWHWRQS